MAEHSAAELHLTAVNWLTGLAPAAAGGCILLLLEDKTPLELRFGLALIVALLLMGFVFGTLVQFHAVRAIGLTESGQTDAAKTSTNHRDSFMMAMLSMLYAAVAIFAIGAFILVCRHGSPDSTSPPSGWRVVSTGGNPGTETIVVSDERQSRLVLLLHGPGGVWKSTEYSNPRVDPKGSADALKK